MSTVQTDYKDTKKTGKLNPRAYFIAYIVSRMYDQWGAVRIILFPEESWQWLS